MKRTIYILLFLLPVITYAQQNWYKYSPLDEMWQDVGNPGFSIGRSYYTSLAFSPVDCQPYVAYVDVPLGPGNTGPGTVMKFDGTQWVNVGIPGFTIVTIGYTSLAFSPVDSLPYVAFAAGCSSSLQATVMKFDGTNWVDFGNEGFSPGTACFTSLAFNPVNGQPYVAFLDLMNSSKASVMRFDGNNWVYVGTPDFSARECNYIRIAFSPSGIPYVVYQDITDSLIVSVLKYDGTNWMNVGSEGFTSGESDEVGFGISPLDGQPYVAIDDALNFHQIKVMKFDGSNWVTVGNIGSTQGWATRMCVTFSPSGQLYVSYWDSSYPGLCVKTFDGSNWTTVGNTGFSAGYPDYPSFRISLSGDPYLAYMDEGDSSKATVMKYDFPTGINEQKESRLSLYPNPVTTQLTININNLTGIDKFIDIYDLRENKLFETQSVTDKVNLNVENYPPGIYIVRLRTKGSNWVGKFCKNW
jgi:hypothetical protein